MRDRTEMTLARDAVEAMDAMKRAVLKTLEALALDPSTLTAEQVQALHRWQERWPHEPDFRRGIPLLYQQVSDLATLLDDHALLRHVAWSMDAVVRWLQPIHDQQKLDRS